MSFTLTSQSVIRFESSTSPLGDEWPRTLMFFNVDISRGVHCDHRNEITAPRTQDRNGKRRNPGGGLSNPIIGCAMPFGEPNGFYDLSRDDFDHRGSRPRRHSLGGRRKNPLFCDSRRHLQYRSTKPRSHADVAPFSFCATKSSAHRYVSPDHETANGYNEVCNRCAFKSYQNEEYQQPNQISRDLTYPQAEADLRVRFDTEFSTGSSYESPDYYTYQRSNETPPYRSCSPYYPRELSGNNFNTNGWEYLSQLNFCRPRGKQRQASGSMVPQYPLDCYDKYHDKDCKNVRYKEPNDRDYEDHFEDLQPVSEFGHKVRYFPLKCSDYEDYGEERLRTPPLPPPKKIKSKIIQESKAPYRALRKKGFSITQLRNNKTETDRIQNTDFLDKLSREPGSRNKIRSKEPERRHRSRSRESESCRRYRFGGLSHHVKLPPFGAPFIKAREASGQYNRNSKVLENNPNAKGTVPRRNPEKQILDFSVEEIPQPYKKYIKKEKPLSNFHLDINDEIPRRQRNFISDPIVTFGNISSSKINGNHERKSSIRPSSYKYKLIEFGSEIPYRQWKKAAPSPMQVAFDIPYKKKDWTNDFKSDLDNEYYAVPVKKYNGPRVKLNDVKNLHSQKSIMQKISGFLKMSKKSQKRSKIFKDKMKIVRNQRHDDQDNGKYQPASNLPKSTTRFEPQKSKEKPISGQKQSILAEPSLSINTERFISKIGTGCHYPTVFKGKCRIENDDVRSACDIFGSMRCPKFEHSDRIFSGNCSLNNDVMNNEPIEHSEHSLTDSLKIVASKDFSSHGSSNGYSCYRSDPSCLSIPPQGSVEENEFRNVRFSSSPSICQSASLTSNSSQESTAQGIMYSKPTLLNRQSIETCSKPPSISNSTSLGLGCNCSPSRICPHWSLTHKSLCCHPLNPHKLECNTFRPTHLGLRFPSSFEISSRPPTVVPFELNKKSRLKGPNNRLNRTSNRRVCLQINSSNRSQSRSSSGKTTTISDENSSFSDKSPCSSEENISNPCCRALGKLEKPKFKKSQNIIGNFCEVRNIESKPSFSCGSKKGFKTKDKSSVLSLWCEAEGEIDNIEIPNCKQIQCNIGNVCEEQKTKFKLRSSSSVKSIDIINPSPGSSGKSFKKCVISSCSNAKGKVDNMEEKPKSQSIMTNLGKEQKNPYPPRPTKSYCVPQLPSKCPCSTISECSRNLLQTNSKCNSETMQLVRLPDSKCLPCIPNTNSEITKSVFPLPCEDSAEPISGGNLTSDGTEKSTCDKNIVEELKQELLNTFKKERPFQRPFYRNTPHFMIFPCPTPQVIRSNQLYGHNSVLCWAACSKPPRPL